MVASLQQIIRHPKPRVRANFEVENLKKVCHNKSLFIGDSCEKYWNQIKKIMNYFILLIKDNETTLFSQ